MKPTNIGCLFDLDGVLVDSETEYTRIWGKIDRAFPTGVPDFPLVIKGTTLPNILATYFPESLHSSIKEMLFDEEARMDYRLLPGVEAFLDVLAEAGIPAAIVTSSSLDKMDKVYGRLPGFRSRFRAVITDGDVSHSKPSPEGYILAAERLGIPSERCCVFEDSFAGLEAGMAAGGAVVALATTNPRASLTGRAHRVIDTLADFTLADLAALF